MTESAFRWSLCSVFSCEMRWSEQLEKISYLWDQAMRTRTLFNSFSKKRKRNLRFFCFKNGLTSHPSSYLKILDLLFVGDEKLRTIKPKFLILKILTNQNKFFVLNILSKLVKIVMLNFYYLLFFLKRNALWNLRALD